MARTSDPKSGDIVDAIVDASPNANSVGQGSRTVTTAGTPVQLSASSVPCKRVRIQANASNTDVVAVGGSAVSANASTRNGTWLFATQGEWFQVSNLNLLYLDAAVSGEKVSYYYEK